MPEVEVLPKSVARATGAFARTSKVRSTMARMAVIFERGLVILIVRIARSRD